MNKDVRNKYEFISDLLNEKNITSNQRSKIIELASKEIGLDGSLEERIEKIEEKLEGVIIGSNDGKETEATIKNEKGESEKSEGCNYSDLPKYYYPSNIYKFLLKYNTDKVLKSTCHEIDSNELETINQYCRTERYDYAKHIEKIEEAFKKINKEFAPTNIKALIRGYLSGKNYAGNPISGWSSQNIKINWQSQELKQWSAKNSGIPPNLDEGLMEKLEKIGFEFEQPIKFRNETLKTFSELVVHFKRLFHIRGDNSLKDIINSENDTKYIGKVEFQINDNDFPNNIEFFTDVDKLKQAYNKIIELIIDQKNSSKPRVRLSLIEKEKTIEFSILHLDGVYNKSINNTIERLGSTYRNLIENQINGLCNFYVRADFENNESFKIGIWDKPDLWKENKPEPEKLEKSVGGVEHIFEIVKY